MVAMKSWERASAAVEGYILPAGESLERPYFPNSRALAWTASTGGLIGAEEGVLEGELLLQIGSEVERAGPGTFAFCPIGCVHAFRAAGEETARVLIIALPPGFGEGYFRELARIPADAGKEEWERLGQKWGTVVVGPPLEGQGPAQRA